MIKDLLSNPEAQKVRIKMNTMNMYALNQEPYEENPIQLIFTGLI